MNMNRTRKLFASAAVTALVVGVGASCSDDSGGDDDKAAGGGAGGAGASASAAADAESGVEEKVNTLIQTGIEQAQGGDLVSARTTFNNALVIDPGNKFALFNLGVIEQSEGRPKVAIEFYDKALKSDPSYTPALYNKAILLEPDDLAAAVALYEQILTVDPEASTTYLRLSFAYDTLGQPDKAEEARQKAVELDPALASETAAPKP